MAAPLLQEAAVLVEAAALTRSPLWRGDGFPAGEGRPVVLVSGFCAPEWSLAPLAVALARAGWRPTLATTFGNVDCAEQGTRRVVRAVEDAVAATGQAAAVIGHSRGGHLALAAAARRPEHVDLVVTLGTPAIGGRPLGLPVLALGGVVGLLGALGVPGLASPRCRTGACCRRVRAALDAPLPAGAVHVAVVADRDAIAPAAAAAFPWAARFDAPATHLGLALSTAGWGAVAGALRAGLPAA